MNYINFTPFPQSNTAALFDSECTGHLLIANVHCNNQQLAESPSEVRLPNGVVISSTHISSLDLPYLPTASRQDHILPGLYQHSLLSVGQMCDSGCAITFTANKVAVKHGAATIFKRYTRQGLRPLAISS
jgi:hypothetical protein